MNIFKITDTLTAIIFYDGENIKIIADVCPHLGGPLSKGKFCPKTQMLTCPWHGYKFCTAELVLKENPNEKIWIKKLAADRFEQFKTPKFKLRQLKYTVENAVIHIQA